MPPSEVTRHGPHSIRRSSESAESARSGGHCIAGDFACFLRGARRGGLRSRLTIPLSKPRSLATGHKPDLASPTTARAAPPWRASPKLCRDRSPEAFQFPIRSLNFQERDSREIQFRQHHDPELDGRIRSSWGKLF